MKKQTLIRGNVIVENIKVGDIHYEYDMNLGIKSQVITKPVLKNGTWAWQSKNLTSDSIINYMTSDVNSEDYALSQQLGIELYDYEAYKVSQYI